MLSRRSFLKTTGAAVASATFGRAFGLALHFKRGPRLQAAAPWPTDPTLRLGRMCWPWGVSVMSRPTLLGTELRKLYPEEVVTIVRDVVGQGLGYHNHVWNELDTGGYVYAPYLQPVRNHLQTPPATLPSEGAWGEISVPYIDARAQPKPEASIVYRLYYSAVLRVAEIATGPDAAPWYLLTLETGVRMYVPASMVRLIGADELTPLSPDVDPGDKRVVVSLTEQAITAYEREIEVFRARISSGANYFGDDGLTLLNGTPNGAHNIWQKRISRHMQGGTVDAGYDVPGVAWVSYFASNGAALHSTYWHNDFGVPKSHGCLNCLPEDAKWLFRWTMPHVAYEPGDLTVNWENRGTVIDIQVSA